MANDHAALPLDFDPTICTWAVTAGVVHADVPCEQCGYSTKMLPAGGHCPECGHLIRLSLRADRLCFSEIGWLKTMRGGLLIVAGSAALIGVMPILTLIIPLALLLLLVAFPAWAIGVFIATTGQGPMGNAVLAITPSGLVSRLGVVGFFLSIAMAFVCAFGLGSVPGLFGSIILCVALGGVANLGLVGHLGEVLSHDARGTARGPRLLAGIVMIIGVVMTCGGLSLVLLDRVIGGTGGPGSGQLVPIAMACGPMLMALSTTFVGWFGAKRLSTVIRDAKRWRG